MTGLAEWIFEEGTLLHPGSTKRRASDGCDDERNTASIDRSVYLMMRLRSGREDSY